MGCQVSQTEQSTTVTGPAFGALRAIPHVDMETMTDAFLTATALAATARGTTQITGIANQRVKECNRIAAMKDQLAKFGVTCNELPDGIEIIGKPIREIGSPRASIHCYDDHRVAMSFSVLSVASTGPVVIDERECVGKTWPGWWDVLSQTFQVDLEGAEAADDTHEQSASSTKLQRSVFIIGMRGAGKTTAGHRMAKMLGWEFTDLDRELEIQAGQDIPSMIRGSRGWEGFRADEVELLRNVMRNKANGHVFSCGGGLVETPAARDLLKAYVKSGGAVVLVHRNTDQVVEYLMRDPTRPAFSADIRQVYLRRKPWYQECSNFLYFSPHAGGNGGDIPSDFRQFVETMSGRSTHHEDILEKDNSFFVSLTLPDLKSHLHVLPCVAVGSDAVELRVDLLANQDVDHVMETVSLLRNHTGLPVIFTVRTASQGGKFPNDAVEERFRLYRLGLRLGVEYLDVEVDLDDDSMNLITAGKGSTRIIASHHDPHGTLSWRNASWISFYNRALQYGDIIKLVGVASSMEDNFQLLKFKQKLLKEHGTPIIALNMGEIGKLSRVLGGFLTPVSHPDLPFKAAPGQLSAAEIRQSLALLGKATPRHFHLFGSPIAMSRSPALHNSLFRLTGLPHHYGLLETDQVTDTLDTLRREGFGGASVTIPLKRDIMEHLDELTEAAATIGAVNTVIPSNGSSGSGKPRLIGDNTDWKGMVQTLRNAGLSAPTEEAPAMVVGSGGTTRAAVFALQSLGFSPIYVVGRNANKTQALVADFPAAFKLEVIVDVSDAAKLSQSPVVVISTIPADRPIDAKMKEALEVVFRLPHDADRYLLEMAYKPSHTAMMQMAEDAGHFKTIPGLEVLAAQGWHQVSDHQPMRGYFMLIRTKFQLWTGITPLFSDTRDAVLGRNHD